jgi:serine/threonine protein kinase
MGCNSSQDGGNSGLEAGGAGGAKGGGDKKGGQKRLLDFYNVGEMLGQGAFGIVYACKPLGSDRDCAVKMVDKVETPVDKIKEEAEMLQTMDHENVIKCHDVIYEKCFVCIVMDRLRGGDLIVGMQAHWKSKGKIPVMATVPITAQMASSIAYLHNRCVIHRDVKGDNYLCDRPDIVDAGVRIVLTDFGTAVACKPDERLREKCGTKLYWAPEFYKLDYSLKVDIWAMGVVVYGLLNGKFPFRDEKDINSKTVTVPKGTPKECAEFVNRILEKKEDKRADHKVLLNDPWIKGQCTAPGDTGGQEEFKPDADAFNEGGANHGIQDRRQELVERLQDAKKPGQKGKQQEEHYWKEWFSIVDRHAKNSTLKYEWWSHSKVDEAGILSLDGAKAINDAQGNSAAGVEEIGKQLREHGISTDRFGQGQAKTLAQLSAEVQSGAAVLMLDAAEHKKLVRVVDVVLLRICAPGNKTKFLLETGEKFSDGRQRQIVRLPGTKKEPHMNSKQMAEKIVADLINLEGAKVNFDFSTKEIFEEQEDSPSYPGVLTVYRKEIIEGMLAGDANSNYVGKNAKNPKDWAHQDKTGNTKYFAWMTDKQCAQKNVKFKAPEEGEEVSGLVQAPIGLEEEQLRKYFNENGVDISKFGVDQAKTLKDISAELIKGESSLMQNPKGGLIRVVDVVVIKLIHSVTGSILVQTEQTYPDGNKVNLKRLPGAKRRPDENQFLTARRILKRQSKVEENHVTLDAGGVQVAEEEKDSLAYPGLHTVYRKRIITATLAKETS